MRRCIFLLSLLLCALALPCHAHDPSAWGGVYRSRDFGATWFSIDGGLFIGGALAVAISPTDPNRLLYATDTRLLSSTNGGRDWKQEGDGAFSGPTLAVLFHRDGKGAIASTAAGVFWTDDGVKWRDSGAPSGAAPARAMALGAAQGRVYLAGARGLYVSDNGGRNWSRAGEGLPDGVATALLAVSATQETLFVLLGGDLWASTDGAQTWRPAGAGLPHAKIDAIAADETRPGALWAAAADQVYSSEDSGLTWHAVGQALTEGGTAIRGIAVSGDGRTMVLSTHRGILRSEDAGDGWKPVEGNLPVHLEAGPLTRDPHDAATLYAGFSLTPYGEVWRRAEQGSNLLSQIDPVSIAGGAAFLGLLVVGGTLAVRWLARARAVDPDRPSGETSG